MRVMSARQNPNDFLKTLLGRPVVVKLNSGVDYRGVLRCHAATPMPTLEMTDGLKSNCEVEVSLVIRLA